MRFNTSVSLTTSEPSTLAIPSSSICFARVVKSARAGISYKSTISRSISAGSRTSCTSISRICKPSCSAVGVTACFNSLQKTSGEPACGGPEVVAASCASPTGVFGGDNPHHNAPNPQSTGQGARPIDLAPRRVSQRLCRKCEILQKCSGPERAGWSAQARRPLPAEVIFSRGASGLAASGAEHCWFLRSLR